MLTQRSTERAGNLGESTSRRLQLNNRSTDRNLAGQDLDRMTGGLLNALDSSEYINQKPSFVNDQQFSTI